MVNSKEVLPLCTSQVNELAATPASVTYLPVLPHRATFSPCATFIWMLYKTGCELGLFS
jgi:hypothetical protein